MSVGLPLDGFVVLDYAQYVAGPFATMLLADLGADVIKVEPPGGDEWRRYDQFEPGESRYFYSLNRNKRSVCLDLKTDEGRRDSARLIGTADGLVHNCLPDRARRFGLDGETISSINPGCAVVAISGFGRTGPLADRLAYDLVAQALSGLLLSDPREGDPVPKRAGGIAMADFMCGLLAGIGLLAGMLARRDRPAPQLGVSLLAAALAAQVQRFVAVDGLDEIAPAGTLAGPAHLHSAAQARTDADELEPYYRAYACTDGYIALACLNVAQRRAVCELLGLVDPFVANPQAPPVDATERTARVDHVRRVEAALSDDTVQVWLDRFDRAGVPVGEVRPLQALFSDPQVLASGLVADIDQAGRSVRVLGGLFDVDGAQVPVRRPAPALDEHRDQVLGLSARAPTR